MAVISIQQALGYAKNAGFTGNSLVTIVAIAMCESGLDTSIRGRSDPRDRGIVQINSFWHPEVSDACAFDPQCAFQQAYRISASGTNFTQWNTYPTCSSGKMSQVQASMANIPSGSSGSPPAWAQRFMDLSVSQAEAQLNHYPTSPEGWAEGGVDWTPPAGTPITSLLDGVVVGAGYFCKNPNNFFAQDYRTCGGNTQGYGVVTVLSNNPYPNIVPGNQIQIYYQHIIVHPSIKLSNSGGVGQTVKQGDVIGYANPSFNIEVGINIGTEWGGIWGPKSPGPHVDPINFLHTLIGSGVNSSGGTPGGSPIGGIGNFFTVQTINQTIETSSYQAHIIINEVPGFTGICEALDMVEQFVPFELPTQAQSDVAVATQNADITIFNWDTGVPNPFKVAQSASAVTKLPADAFQAILVFATTNFMAFLVRSLFVTAGIILFIALMSNLVNSFSSGGGGGGGEGGGNIFYKGSSDEAGAGATEAEAGASAEDLALLA